MATGLASLSFLSADTPYLPYGLALVVVAAGMGLSVPSLSTGIVTSLPQAQAGVGSGINSAVREIGAALARRSGQGQHERRVTDSPKS